MTYMYYYICPKHLYIYPRNKLIEPYKPKEEETPEQIKNILDHWCKLATDEENKLIKELLLFRSLPFDNGYYYVNSNRNEYSLKHILL